MITRTLANSIEEYTLHPHPDSLKFVVDNLFVKYPNLIMDKEDSIQTNVSILHTTKHICFVHSFVFYVIVNICIASLDWISYENPKKFWVQEG